MMRILSCFKIVPDLDMMQDWTPDSEGRLDFSHVRRMWNCFDEGALEMLLRFRDIWGDTRLDALTVGGASCGGHLKTLAALGFDSAVRIDGGEGYSSERLAQIIAAFVRSRGYDLVVMGVQSPLGNSGRTPLLTAEYLGWVCVTHCIGLALPDSAPEGAVALRSLSDEGEVCQTILTPCVLAVGNIQDSYLRVPTLKDRIARGSKPLEIYSPEHFGASAFEEGVELQGVEPINRKRPGILIDGGSLQERVERLYTGYLQGLLKTDARQRGTERV